jgi:spore germination protein
MDNDKISSRQMQIILILYIFGFGVLALPRTVTVRAGQNGWMSVAVAAAAVMVLVYFIAELARKSGGKCFAEFVDIIVGKPLGKLICILFASRLIILGGLRLRVFGESVREYMLPFTHSWIVLCAMLLLCVYAAVKKFEIQARLAEILVFFMIIPLAYVFFVSLKGSDFSNLLPVWEAVPNRVIRGAYDAVFSFSGIELLLLIIPFVSRDAKIRMKSVSTVAVLGLLMIFVVISTISVFGAVSVSQKTWPVFQMMDSAEIPGRFFARQGAFIMCFWIISAFAAISAEIFFSSVLVKDVINLGKRRYYVILSAAAVLLVALVPQNLTAFQTILKAIERYSGIAFMFIIPFILLIIVNLRRKRFDIP